MTHDAPAEQTRESDAAVAGWICRGDGDAPAPGRQQLGLVVPAMAQGPPGQDALLAVLAVRDANGMRSQALAAGLQGAPHLYAGVFAPDPFRRWQDQLDELAGAGFTGVTNLPSTLMFDAASGDQLGLTHLGVEREMAFLAYAREQGFNVVGAVRTFDRAAQLLAAGIAQILVHPGAVTGDGRAIARTARTCQTVVAETKARAGNTACVLAFLAPGLGDHRATLATSADGLVLPRAPGGDNAA